MSSNPPDLVLRAAERLAAERQQTGVRAPLSEPRIVTDHVRPLPQLAKAAPPPANRTVNISPAILAANGIHLPSSDPSITVTLEEFRSIRRHVIANVARAGTATPNSSLNRTVLVTSARPGDGKTFTSINLALSLANGGESRVLLMDADARRRSMLEYMGVKAELGWVDLLSRSDLALNDVLLNTNIPNLSLLPSGMPKPDLTDLVGSKKMAGLFAELTARDPDAIIVIDTLPCLVSNEPSILAEQVGQVVFVVAANETGRDEVQSSLRHLSGAPVVSLVLNKGEPLMAEQFSKYGYYNYGQNKV